MTSRFSAYLVRRDDKEPWGLRIAGGRDFGAPVTIQRVVPGGVAEIGGVRVGDRLVQVAGQDAGEMCHRDAQMAIKTAGLNLQLELERSGPSPAPKPDVAKGIQQLEIRGSAPPPSEPVVNIHGANSTAQPWKARKSIDGQAEEMSGFRPIGRTFPQPTTEKTEANSGYRPINSSLPSGNNNGGGPQDSGVRRTDHATHGYQAPVLAKVEESQSALSDSGLRKTDHAPYIYQTAVVTKVGDSHSPVSDSGPRKKAPVTAKVDESSTGLQDSGLRKTDHAPYSYQASTTAKVDNSSSGLQDSGLRKTDHAPYNYQASTTAKVDNSSSGLQDSGLRKTDHAPYRYQPTETIDSQRKSSAPVNSFRFQLPSSGHRGSEPSVPPYQRDFARKGSDCFPVPFSASFKPTNSNGPPPVLPKPPSEQRMSFDRGQTTPPRSYGSASPPAPPTAPVPQKTSDKEAKTERPPAICFHCKETVRGPYLMALDRIYCPDHFRCVKCDVQLGKQPFISHQGEVYCLNDYREHVAPRCAKCGEPVEEQQLLAMDQVYHPHCFVCNMCKKPMAKGSFRIGTDRMPYCEEDWKQHFQVVCGRCNFPIEADEQFIDATSNNYHVDCFVCTTCLTKLEGKAFYLRNEQPYCKDHIQTAN